MRSLLRFFVVGVTIVTLTLGAAVGVSAHSGGFGRSGNDGHGDDGHGHHGGQCQQQGEHENGTPDREHHGCGDTKGRLD